MATEDDSLVGSSHTYGTQRVNLTTLSSSELIARINELESRLKDTTAKLSQITSSASTSASADTTDPHFQPPSATREQSSGSKKPKKPPKPFDSSRYSTRQIALKFAYLGHRYNGFEHTNGAKPPLRPTIEETLWKALRKARLIPTDVDPGCDGSFEVVFGEQERKELYWRQKVRLECNWNGLAYSKCGRTDKGVSGFGQVIGLRVRSNRPKENERDRADSDGTETNTDVGKQSRPGSETSSDVPAFDNVRDELPYVAILNSILPTDIKVLAWCANPDPSFDARFSCQERRYKYFFTNPAFCPTPGPPGLRYGNGKPVSVREGWLDIEAMRAAAKKLEGLHDFRNFCKIDASKQMRSCERRINFADVEEWQTGGGLGVFNTNAGLRKNEEVYSPANHVVQSVIGEVGSATDPPGPKVYAFAVHGSAFLWHQVRCMVAVLFLVGQGLEKPEVVDELLDIAKNPARPQYEMASDAPLVLWDCVFPGDGQDDAGGMKWIYAGDEASVPGLANKGDSQYDGRFGVGGLISDLWSQWREAKIKETLAAGLLGLALSQGDGTSLQRGGFRNSADAKSRSQRLFDGGDTARAIGDYVPVMQKSRLDTLKVQNAKYLAGKHARRELKRAEVPSTD